MIYPYLTKKEASYARIKLSRMGLKRKEMNLLLSNFLEREVGSFTEITAREMVRFWESKIYAKLSYDLTEKITQKESQKDREKV